jgi:hypothetical protein
MAMAQDCKTAEGRGNGGESFDLMNERQPLPNGNGKVADAALLIRAVLGILNPIAGVVQW